MAKVDAETILKVGQQNGWIFVGISGATNSGKSTSAKNLKNRYESSEVIHQDDYFREEDDPMHVWIDIRNPPRKHQNWEHQNCIDWDSLLQKMYSIVQNKPKNCEKTFLFIEGHIIFNNPDMIKLFHKKFFIDIEKEVMYKRRILRTYIPADPPGYFDEWVWPQYIENRRLLNNQNDIVFIDGLQTTEMINQEIVNELEAI